MGTLAPNAKEMMKGFIKNNTYPGITDNSALKMTFLSIIPHLAKNFDGNVEKAVEVFRMCQVELDRAQKMTNMEENIMLSTVWSCIRTHIRDEDIYWYFHLSSFIFIFDLADFLDHFSTGNPF